MREDIVQRLLEYMCAANRALSCEMIQLILVYFRIENGIEDPISSNFNDINSINYNIIGKNSQKLKKKITKFDILEYIKKDWEIVSKDIIDKEIKSINNTIFLKFENSIFALFFDTKRINENSIREIISYSLFSEILPELEINFDKRPGLSTFYKGKIKKELKALKLDQIGV